MIRSSIGVAEEFMNRRDGKRGLRWEFAIVTLIGALGAVGHAYVSWRVSSAADTGSLSFSLLGYLLEPLFGVFVLWFGYSIALHYLANSIYDSRNSIFRILKLVPWAIIPIGVGNLLRSGVLFLTFREVDYQAVLADQDSTVLTQGIEPVLEAGMSDPVYLLAPGFVGSTVVVSGYLLISAVETAKAISRQDALKTVGVVIGIHLVYIVYNAVQVI